ncbi:transposase [Sphingobium cupriresistens]|uniref:Transposase n=1 Tax=Sphingobium cupriresistens TaxID=1132417 RepID=A0A8G1ZC96_9SPHN|nr:transposase [Sphingobium cupriresistens]
MRRVERNADLPMISCGSCFFNGLCRPFRDLLPENWSEFDEKFPVRFGWCRTRESWMKTSRFRGPQIAFILKQAEDGTTVEEVCRKAGISVRTYYRWQSKYGGLMPSEMKRLKQLEEENVQLKRLVTKLIPRCIDQNPWAHWRSPRDMMR